MWEKWEWMCIWSKKIDLSLLYTRKKPARLTANGLPAFIMSL